jgi:hypothetical protein
VLGNPGDPNCWKMKMKSHYKSLFARSESIAKSYSSRKGKKQVKEREDTKEYS